MLPFGQFRAAGRTTQEVEAAITENVKGRLLRNPRVWVNIDEYRPFFVEGQVGRPGAYPYQPGLNVRKAVTIAGGLRERASLRKIFVVRERDGVTSRQNVDLNAPVGPGRHDHSRGKLLLECQRVARTRRRRMTQHAVARPTDLAGPAARAGERRAERADHLLACDRKAQMVDRSAPPRCLRRSRSRRFRT